MAAIGEDGSVPSPETLADFVDRFTTWWQEPDLHQHGRRRRRRWWR
jgi:hypothetical protein